MRGSPSRAMVERGTSGVTFMLGWNHGAKPDQAFVDTASFKVDIA